MEHSLKYHHPSSSSLINHHNSYVNVKGEFLACIKYPFENFTSFHLISYVQCTCLCASCPFKRDEITLKVEFEFKFDGILIQII